MWVFCITHSFGETIVSEFYVDPDYTNLPREGTASNPWNKLDSDTEWDVINAALAKGNVIVYFSAREAGSDADQLMTTSMNIRRTDTSDNWVILEGHSKYNMSDASPIWDNLVQRTGAISFVSRSDPAVVTSLNHGFNNGDRIRIDGIRSMGELNGRYFVVQNVRPSRGTFQLEREDSRSYSPYISGGTWKLLRRMRVQSGNVISTNNQDLTTRRRIKVRGFNLVAVNAKIIQAANCHQCVWEDMDLTHLPTATEGPGRHIDGENFQGGPLELHSEEMVFRRLSIHNNFGEGVYINGSGERPEDGGARPGARQITIEDCEIKESALRSNGDESSGFGQGDGIDAKNGHKNLRILRNRIHRNQAIGITTKSGDGLMIGWNFISSNRQGGLELGHGLKGLIPDRAGFLVVQNILVNNGAVDGLGAEFGAELEGTPKHTGLHNGRNNSSTLVDASTDFSLSNIGGAYGVVKNYKIKNTIKNIVYRVSHRISNNELAFQGTGMDWDRGDGYEILYDEWVDGWIVHNIFARSANGGIGLGVNPLNVFRIGVHHNIFYANAGHEFNFGASAPAGTMKAQGLIASHNLYFDPAGGTLVRSEGVSYTASDIQNFDPLGLAVDPQFEAETDFNDPAAWKLKSTSPALVEALGAWMNHPISTPQ